MYGWLCYLRGRNCLFNINRYHLQLNLSFRLVADLEMFSFAYTGYGKDYIKSQKLSPDSYIQMAIQYAFYRLAENNFKYEICYLLTGNYFRLHKVPGAHYESASLRKFIHGRTETIRSCSVQSIKFAQTMLDSSKSANDKAAALRTAIKAHKDYTTLVKNYCHSLDCGWK